MTANDLQNRVGELEQQFAVLEARLAAVERHAHGAAHGAAQKTAQPEAAPPEPAPWKLDAGRLEGLVDDLYSAVRSGPTAAFAFEAPGSGCYLHSHAKNVSRMAMFLAARHGFSEPSVRAIGMAGLLHDAGMDSLPHDLVWLGRPLTPEEYRQVRLHPAAGAEYVRENFRFDGLLNSVIPATIEQHHERSDGSGYPQGLAGEKIHDFARVLAIADSFEAMTMPRPFRKSMHQAEAMRSLLLQGYRTARGGMYDRGLLKTLVWSASMYPPGCEVELSDGRRARVTGTTSDPKRPVVKVSAGGTDEAIDLTMQPGVSIVS